LFFLKKVKNKKSTINQYSDDGRGGSSTRLVEVQALAVAAGCREPLLSSRYKFILIEMENKKRSSYFFTFSQYIFLDLPHDGSYLYVKTWAQITARCPKKTVRVTL
jgi:hypothetical protein